MKRNFALMFAAAATAAVGYGYTVASAYPTPAKNSSANVSEIYATAYPTSTVVTDYVSIVVPDPSTSTQPGIETTTVETDSVAAVVVSSAPTQLGSEAPAPGSSVEATAPVTTQPSPSQTTSSPVTSTPVPVTTVRGRDHETEPIETEDEDREDEHQDDD